MTPIIDASDFNRLRAFLHGMLVAGADLRPFMRWAAIILQDEVEESFAGERSPDGRPWKPLAAATAKKFVTRSGQRQRRGTNPILQVTGRLAASFTTRFDERSATVGSNLVYARVQMLGGGPSRIPARMAMGLSPAGHGEIMQHAISWARDFIESARSAAT